MAHLLGEAPLGNRKDIRNAVEAARKADGWAKATAHNRAQVLYYWRRILSQRRNEIVDAPGTQSWETKQARAEVESRHRAHFFLCRMGRQV